MKEIRKSQNQLVGVLIASSIVWMSATAAASETQVSNQTWSPGASERLVKLPPTYLKKTLDRDFAQSGLGVALEANTQKIGNKGKTLGDLRDAISEADGDLKVELRHQFLAEKRAYLQLMEDQLAMKRNRAETQVKLFSRMLDDLSRKSYATTPSVQSLVTKQEEARSRLDSTLAQVDLTVFDSAAVPESKYAVKYGENMVAVERLLSRIKDHPMSQSLGLDGSEVTQEEMVRSMLIAAEADLALADQEGTILGYMAKLVALDAMALSEEAMDAELADSPTPGSSGPSQAVSFFLDN